MITVVLSFLKSHWQATLIASLILSISATIAFQHLEVRHLSKALAQCHAENSALENSNKALIVSIEDQNEAIASLQSRAESKKANATHVLALAHREAGQHAFRAKRIETQSASKDECAGLKNMMNGFIREQSR